MPNLPLDKPTIIRLAACHSCAAMRGEPCSFNRSEDPSGKRRAAGQSHTDRILRAREIYESEDNFLASVAQTLRL